MPSIYENREVAEAAWVVRSSRLAPGPQARLIDEPEVRVRDIGATTPHGQADVSWAFSGSGWRMHTFFDDWYNDYHITPKKIDLGTLTAETQIPLSIWSAYLEDHTLNNIGVLNDTGISVLLGTPRTFKALESVDTHVVVSMDGPPVIDAQVLFHFDNLTPYVSVSGLRVVLFELPPNWVQAVTDKLEFRTDVFMARDGHEQRRALRKYPRRGTRMRVTGIKDKQHYLLRMLSTKADTSMVFPDYVRWVLTGQDASPADTEVTLSEVPEWALPGALVVLSAPGGGMESGLIDAVDSGTKKVTLHSPINGNYPEGSKFMLGVPGKLAKQIPAVSPTGTITGTVVTYEADPGAMVWWDRVWAAEFDGRKILDIRLNWRVSPKRIYQSFRETLDFGQGVVRTTTPVPFVGQTISATWTEIGLEEAKALEGFFILHRGTCKSFWLPSFSQDFFPMDPLVSGQHVLRIKGQDFYAAFTDSPVHKAIRLRLTDGTYITTKVTSIVAVDDPEGHDTHIIVNDAWPRDIALSDIVTCQWVYRVRFASDALSLAWPVRGIGEFNLSFRLLEAD